MKNFLIYLIILPIILFTNNNVYSQQEDIQNFSYDRDQVSEDGRNDRECISRTHPKDPEGHFEGCDDF